jgi:peptidoglycan/LPS O-acetylase OafA/YrhL
VNGHGLAIRSPVTETATDHRGGSFPYQPGLDGVRALAVGAVLVFHGGVAGLPGGFLGVDAFFVLSGFLITSLLLTERDGTGRIDLVRFWVRRARRLLPALLVLLVTVVVVSRFLLSAEELPALRWDALAALAYVANWRMADRGGDYFAQTAPSPLQHTWSLGIEEQFYLIWPLLLVLVLAVPVRRRRAAARPAPDPDAGPPPVGRRWLALLLVVCCAGAVASAVAAALLYRPDDVNRAYYGTDTRAVALLVGCATALIVRYVVARRQVSRHIVLGALALVGAVGTGVLWATAEGNSRWLYKGELVAGALAVAGVIAHVVVSPAGPTARVLALSPLVWIGRISYGLYLWHWPVFGWLNADQTGLGGPRLLALRLAATVAVSVVSYVLVERPVRTGRWPWRRPRLAPALAAGAVLAVAVATVLVTRPPAVSPPSPIALDVTPSPSAANRSPISRPGRRPGDKPRITLFGDSVSWSLGENLPPQNALQVQSRGIPGCGIARLPEIRYIGLPHPNYPGCERWDVRWKHHVYYDDPDVAVILLDRWELMDRKLNGRYQHVGEPEFDAYLSKELDRAIRIVASRRAHVVLLTAPYTRRAERPDGRLWPEDDPARVDAWNALLRAAAERHGTSLLDLNAQICPEGEFTWRIDGIRVRSDGLHFTPDGVRRFIAPWLLPQLARLAVHGPES